jgi:hypothetical protein
LCAQLTFEDIRIIPLNIITYHNQAKSSQVKSTHVSSSFESQRQQEPAGSLLNLQISLPWGDRVGRSMQAACRSSSSNFRILGNNTSSAVDISASRIANGDCMNLLQIICTTQMPARSCIPNPAIIMITLLSLPALDARLPHNHYWKIGAHCLGLIAPQHRNLSTQYLHITLDAFNRHLSGGDHSLEGRSTFRELEDRDRQRRIRDALVLVSPYFTV